MTTVKRKIMIIEDNKDLQDIYKHSFEKYGYTAEVKSNGLEGAEAVAASLPDAVLLDLMMPGMDGFGFLRMVKETGGLTIPVVVCSNISDVDTINRALREGAEAVILKVDYSGKQLVDKVTSIVDDFYSRREKKETPQ